MTVAEVTEREVSQICKHYKVEEEKVLELFQKRLSEDEEACRTIKESKKLSRLKKRSVYKKFIKTVKRDVYMFLRQYKRGGKDLERGVQELEKIVEKLEQNTQLFKKEVPSLQNLPVATNLLRDYSLTLKSIVEGHVSTKERLKYTKAFNNWLVRKIEEYSVRTVLDIGCGVYPLVFPFKESTTITDFVAIDREGVVIRAIRAFACAQKLFDCRLRSKRSPRIRQEGGYVQSPSAKIRAFTAEIGQKPWNEYLPEGKAEFDLAIMMKLISVTHRQPKQIWAALASVPAKYILLTFNKESMIRKERVVRREEAIAHKFLALAGRKKILDTFETENEVMWWVGESERS